MRGEVSYPKALDTLHKVLPWLLYLCLTMPYRTKILTNGIAPNINQSQLRHCATLSIYTDVPPLIKD